ncbi:hypothetical protein SASPL_142352 [Salvia splendens]|uniref:Uncharacterized protein n=1 Tax=Salvia splendens TaxID=180675 RepID=A0A8X8Z9B8_SALSN|nr:hypothetical protein SASPL_142352 [Salvia splendens]
MTYRRRSTCGLYGNKPFLLRLSMDVVNEAKQSRAATNGRLKLARLLLPCAWPSLHSVSSDGVPPSFNGAGYVATLISLESAKIFGLFTHDWPESSFTPGNSTNKLQKMQMIRNDLAESMEDTLDKGSFEYKPQKVFSTDRSSIFRDEIVKKDLMIIAYL